MEGLYTRQAQSEGDKPEFGAVEAPQDDDGVGTPQRGRLTPHDVTPHDE